MSLFHYVCSLSAMVITKYIGCYLVSVAFSWQPTHSCLSIWINGLMAEGGKTLAFQHLTNQIVDEFKLYHLIGQPTWPLICLQWQSFTRRTNHLVPTPLNTQHSWVITPPTPPFVTNCVQTAINLPCIQKNLPENFSQAKGFKVHFMPIYVKRKNFSNYFIPILMWERLRITCLTLILKFKKIWCQLQWRYYSFMLSALLSTE